jgi:hypothetical protein
MRLPGPDAPSRVSKRAGVVLLALALTFAVFSSTRGITDETVVSLHGDMPRHMMNGVFLWDFARSGAMWSVDDAVAYAREYFVRYPALSLGHHPPLVAALLVPFYAVAGVSVFSARLAIVCCMLVSVLGLFSLTRRLYDTTVAGWAALLFAAQPFIAPYGQEVMSEAPVLALVLLTLDTLLRFCATGRTRHYAAFVLLAAATLYAKQLAAFLFPLFALVLVLCVQRSRLLKADVVLWTVGGAVLCVPIVAATLILSPFNVALVAGAVPALVSSDVDVRLPITVLASLLDTQLSVLLLVAMVAGIILSIVRRDGRIVLPIAWFAVVIGSVTVLIGPFEAPRYAILAVPAYCLSAATLALAGGPTVVGRLAIVLLAASVLWDARLASQVRPVGAGGYEAAAMYAASRTDSPTVLYSGSVDTGYFVFFTRKHDAGGRSIVLRADKTLTTSMMGSLDIENRVSSVDDIHQLLRRYGTRIVVIEDRPTGSASLDLLREELRTTRFIERRRFPIVTRDRRLAGTDLVAYEYVDATRPDPHAAIDVGLPLIGRNIQLTLGDLLEDGP